MKQYPIGQIAEQNYHTLHDAVRNGSLEAVRYFLQSNTEYLNQSDASGNTPLLLAVCIADEKTYNEIVELLIEHGADVNVYNKGMTPLYNAVFYKRKTSVEMLLKAGAWLRPSNRNELHLLAETGGSNIVNLILEDKRCTSEIINSPDEDGNTALHVAAQFHHKNCLRTLIKHGGDLTVVNNEKETVTDLIFKQFINPEKFITDLLDENIVVEEREKYKCIYNIDFSVLAPKHCERQMEVISTVLVTASEGEKIEILQHPLIELFLILKWSKICYFFYFWISIYVIFAISMGLFSNILIHRFDSSKLWTCTKWLLILSSAGLLGHAILQCILVRKNYVQRYEMWMNIICTCLSLTVAIIADRQHDDSPGTDLPNWVLNITSVAVLLAWIELMLLIGRLPSLGYYALMFSAVLQNVVKVLFAFVCLVIGFSLSFSIQFSNEVQFSNPWRALVKTVVMMTGEYEYSTLFADDLPDTVGLQTVCRFIFLTFIIVTSIVLMNLMVGVAVSDIQELHRQGRAKKLEKQADFLSQLEKVISSKQLKSKFVPVIIKKVFLGRSFVGTKYKLWTSVEFQKTEGIPRRIIESIAFIAKTNNERQREI